MTPNEGPPTAFDLDTWARDAARLVVCPGCYGSGQRPTPAAVNPGGWELCGRCRGAGRAPADPHVTRLVERVRELEAQLAAGGRSTP